MKVDGGDDLEVENDAGMDQEAKKTDDGGHGSAEAANGGEEEATGAKSSTPEVVDMTFSDIVHDVASREEQSGVTVPFYFICLLPPPPLLRAHLSYHATPPCAHAAEKRGGTSHVKCTT
ncbi:unnamed protein product [Pylaiella littoralis]